MIKKHTFLLWLFPIAIAIFIFFYCFDFVADMRIESDYREFMENQRASFTLNESSTPKEVVSYIASSVHDENKMRLWKGLYSHNTSVIKQRLQCADEWLEICALITEIESLSRDNQYDRALKAIHSLKKKWAVAARNENVDTSIPEWMEKVEKYVQFRSGNRPISGSIGQIRAYCLSPGILPLDFISKLVERAFDGSMMYDDFLERLRELEDGDITLYELAFKSYYLISLSPKEIEYLESYVSAEHSSPIQLIIAKYLINNSKRRFNMTLDEWKYLFLDEAC